MKFRNKAFLSMILLTGCNSPEKQEEAVRQGRSPGKSLNTIDTRQFVRIADALERIADSLESR